MFFNLSCLTMLKKISLLPFSNCVFFGKIANKSENLPFFVQNKLFLVFFNTKTIQKQILLIPVFLIIRILSKKSFLLYYFNFFTKNSKFFFFRFFSFIKSHFFFIEKTFLFKLSLRGIGFKIEPVKSFFKISIGFSHAVFLSVPIDVRFRIVDVQNLVLVGFSKQFLGQMAARLTFLKKPDVYKNKGFFFINMSKEKHTKTIIFKKEFQKKTKLLMLLYVKLLRILLALNIPNGETTKSIGHSTGFSSRGFRYKKNLYDAQEVINSLFRVMNIVSVISFVGGTVLFVGSSKEVQKFYFFYRYKIKRTIFLSKWFSGLLTNWNQLATFLITTNQTQSILFKKSKKLRFLRFFYELQIKEKPALVVFFNYNFKSHFGVVQECLLENIPLVVLGLFSLQDSFLVPYRIPANKHNFCSDWFFFQLLFNQVTKKS